MNNIYPIDAPSSQTGPRLQRDKALVGTNSQRELVTYANRYNGIFGSIRLMVDEFINEKEYYVKIDRLETIGLTANVLYFLLSFSLFLYFWFNGYSASYVDSNGKEASKSQLDYNKYTIYAKDVLSGIMVLIVSYKTIKRIQELSKKKIDSLKNGNHRTIYVSQRRT